MPNGLVRAQDGIIYVPSTTGGTIDIFSIDQDHTFRKLDTLRTLPIDNLSIDRNGDIYAAALPQVWKWVRSSKMPFDINPGSTVLRIRRDEKLYNGKRKHSHHEGYDGKYLIETVMEDDGTVLPGATTAVHDAETGTIFLGGAVAPYITICQTRGI
jgi:arylesterase/paraoxonase